MAITFDPAKQNKTLADRGVDFADAELVFAGPLYSRDDLRADYGERRIMTVGFLRQRMVIVIWTPRGDNRHVISMSMRKANAREQARYAPLLVGETDLAKVDAHVIQPEEYEEIPELTDEWFENADFYIGDKLIRRGRGRPRVDVPKKQVTLRLDADVVERFRASGPGWQGRVNEILRGALETTAASAGVKER